MKPRTKWIVTGVCAAVLASLIPPYISADEYRESVRGALESALGRKVEISSVRFRVLPQPGFTVSNVIIGEDPAIGAEPVAYVTTLRAAPRLLALMAGRLEFSSVDLEDASLNLTRVDKNQGGIRWNVSPLMRPALLTKFPSVHIRGGRINFKSGDTKSLFYLLDTDLDLWPPVSATGAWTLKVHGEPARTDRMARGFGSFSVRGEWFPRDNATTLDVQLENSELSDLLMLFNRHESDIHGDISGQAHLAGPLNHIGLAGRLTVSNLHGWNQAPPGGNRWPLELGGVLDAYGQTIDVAARPGGSQPAFGIRYRVADYLRRPRWGVTVNLNKFPLSPLPGVARNLGWSIPADFKLDGTALGAVSFSSPDGSTRMNGGLNLASATVAVGSTPPLRIPTADMRFSGSTITFGPSAITDVQNETAILSGAWNADSGGLEASLSSDGMQIGSLSRQISVAGIPLLSQATAGTWNGNLHYSGDDSLWTGELHLQDTVIPFEAFSDPLHLTSADVTIDESGLAVRKLKLSIGAVEGQGEYNYDPSAARPHRFRITLAQADGAALEKVLMPALRRGNFFTYAFSFGRTPQPDWLRNMHADGTIQAGTLDLAGTDFTKFRARVVWDGMEVRLTTLQTQLGTEPGGPSFKGGVTIHLDRRQPAYEIAGKLTGMPWRSGKLDAEGTLATSGTGVNLLAHMRAKGLFEGREIDLSPIDSYETVAGAFDWAWDARNPRLHLTQLVMKSGEDTFQGTADSQDDGQVVLKLTDGNRHIQAAGAIFRGDALKPVTP
ncbi:MAG TPA: hypothetical protein VG273_06890 [Bryobacteraceae bacterium]|jgi:AsmA protein|nr:hypothetical protein [Bryobacteraceae bacterium]